MPGPEAARRALGTAAERARPRVLNIGQVLADLSGEFPGISASKIRFLEEKGLVSPQRTAAGYRKYSSQDVERLRFVLALQRDQYLPLKVIKDYLDASPEASRWLRVQSRTSWPRSWQPGPGHACFPLMSSWRSPVLLPNWSAASSASGLSAPRPSSMMNTP